MVTPVEAIENGTPGSTRKNPNRPNENLLSLGKLRNSTRSNATISSNSGVELAELANLPDEKSPPPPSYDSVVKIQMNDPEVVSLPSTSQLPRYVDVAGLADAPPTYHSLFADKVLRVINPFADDSDDPNETSINAPRCKFATLILNFLLFVFLITFVLLLPVGMITIGIIFVHSCPVQPRIPIYLIVLGFFQMLECCGRLGYKLFQNGQQRNSWRERYRRKDPLVYFVIVWFVIGSMWVYQTDPNCKDCGQYTFRPTPFLNHTLFNVSSTPSIPTVTTTTDLKPSILPGSHMFCDKIIYNFAFWIITTYYSVIGFFCLMILVDVTLRTMNRCFCPQR